MKIVQPKPFTFEAGPRAVLLLHGFTGHSADVRMLGRFLEKKGYTSHAPIYRGHGVSPEELIQTGPQQWWADVKQGYEHLLNLGYQDIAVAGLSLGGVLSLKLAYSKRVKAVIPMSTPVFFDNETQLSRGFEQFVKHYKQMEKKDSQTIETETQAVLDNSHDLFNRLGSLIGEVKENVDKIDTPTMIVQARQDELINTDSGTYILDHIQSEHKQLKWYEHSSHIITLDKEKNDLYEDIYQFLETLNWQD